MNQLLTPIEVAHYLQLPVGTLHAQRYRGKAPGALAIKVGRHLRWRQSDLDAWLDGLAAGQMDSNTASTFVSSQKPR
jgi:predicted DNA-binding transcriptional regulator AlpA